MSEYVRAEYTPLFTQVQDIIAESLNSDPQLSSLGITFYPEHNLEIEYEIKKNLGQQGIVGIVNTLKGFYGGHNGNTNAWEIEAEIDVVENPTIRRAQMKKMGLSAGSTADIIDWVQESLCGPSSPSYGKFCAQQQQLGEDSGLIVGKSIVKTFAIADVSAIISGDHMWHCPYALASDLEDLSGLVYDMDVKVDWLDTAVKELSAEISGGGEIWEVVGELSSDVSDLSVKMGNKADLSSLNNYLPLNLTKPTEISGNTYLDFNCLTRFQRPVVMNGALDVLQLNIVNYDVDSYTSLSAIDEDTIGFVGGFNREHTAMLNLKNGTIAYTSDIPTTTSELTNDSGFITSTQVKPASSSLYAGAADSSIWSYSLAGRNAAGWPDQEKFLTFRNGTANLAVAEYKYGSWFLSEYNGTTFDPPIEMTYDFRQTITIQVGHRSYTWSVGSYCWYGGRYIIKAEKLNENDRFYSPTTFGWLNTSPRQIEWYETTYTDTRRMSIDTVNGQYGIISCTRNEFRPTQIQHDVAYEDELPTKVSDLTNDAGYLTTVSWNDVQDKPSIPTKTSDLVNDSNYVNQQTLNTALLGKVSKSGDTVQWIGIGRIEQRIQANEQLGFEFSIDEFGSAKVVPQRDSNVTLNFPSTDGTLATTADISSQIPTKTSDLTNDSGFITNTTLNTELALKQDKLSNAQTASINSVVDERTTYFTFPNNEVQSAYVEGRLDTYYLQELNPVLTHDKILTATEVKIGRAVTEIGYGAFNGCSNLAKVTIPDSVVTIGEMAFGQCYALARLEIPDGVSTINNLFNYTDVHADMVFGKGIQRISEGMFHYVSPNSVTFIGKTMAQVQAMTDYPWDIEDTSIIKTYNIATQEWVLEQLSALQARITELENQ